MIRTVAPQHFSQYLELFTPKLMSATLMLSILVATGLAADSSVSKCSLWARKARVTSAHALAVHSTHNVPQVTVQIVMRHVRQVRYHDRVLRCADTPP